MSHFISKVYYLQLLQCKGHQLNCPCDSTVHGAWHISQKALNHSWENGCWSLSWEHSTAPLRLSTRSYNRLPSSRIVGSGAAGYISSEDAFKILRKGIEDKTLQLFVPNSKRLEGYTQWEHFSEKRAPLEYFKKHYMVSLKKARGQRLFLLGKTWRNKKASKVLPYSARGLVGHSPRVPYKEGRRSSPTRNSPHVILVTLRPSNPNRTLTL